METLIQDIAQCTLCASKFQHSPRPVVQVSSSSRLAIIGQAPSRTVHETGVPWDDPSGKRLKSWLQISEEDFYDDTKVALLPMAFCYPGKGASGDLPPPPICATTWHQNILKELRQLKLVLLLGQYALRRYLPDFQGVTHSVKSWRDQPEPFLALPHPSPRNLHWFKKNAWFETELLPELRTRVKLALS